MFPDAVYTIWWVGLIVTLVVFVPLSVYLLHRTGSAARSIQRYAAETLQAAGGIARNTANDRRARRDDRGGRRTCWRPPERVERKLDTVATVLGAAVASEEAAHAADPDAGHRRARRAGARGLSHRDRLGAARHAQERRGHCRRARGGAGSYRTPCPRSSPPSTARWARCSAASRPPTAISGGRPRCSGCSDRTRTPCASRTCPIEFDAQGKPFLRAGVADPYAPSSAAPRGRARPADRGADRGAAAAQRIHQGQSTSIR